MDGYNPIHFENLSKLDSSGKGIFGSVFEFDGDLKRTFKEVCLFIGMGRKRFYPPGKLRKKGMEVAVQFAEDLLTMASKRLGQKDS